MTFAFEAARTEILNTVMHAPADAETFNNICVMASGVAVDPVYSDAERAELISILDWTAHEWRKAQR